MLHFAALLALSTAGNATVTRNDAKLELKSAYDAWIAAINRGDNESGMTVTSTLPFHRTQQRTSVQIESSARIQFRRMLGWRNPSSS